MSVKLLPMANLTQPNIELLDQQLRKAYPTVFEGVKVDREGTTLIVKDSASAEAVAGLIMLAGQHNPSDKTEEQIKKETELARQQAAETAAKEAAGKLDLASLAARIAYLEAKLGIQLEADVKG